jgi:thiol-disulfide isomerase/thioredoxin
LSKLPARRISAKSLIKGDRLARPSQTAFTFLAAIFISCSHQTPVHDRSPTRLDDFAPSLKLPAAGGGYFRPETLKGKVVMVTFFATWCFPCLGQMPLLQTLQAKYGPEGFSVVAVGMDLEGAVVLDPFVREYQLAFPVLLADEKIRKGETAFGRIASLPSSLLLGRDGRLITAFTGLPVASELEDIISREVHSSALSLWERVRVRGNDS